MPAGSAVPSGCVLWLCAGFVVACAGPFSQSEGDTRFVHKKLGYSVEQPTSVDGTAWRRFDLGAADLAYRDGAGNAISLSTRCTPTSASVAALARHVTIGTERTALIVAGPFALGELPGWSQTFDTVEDGVGLRIKAITVRGASCVYDWLLVARSPESFATAEPAFDGWVDSFLPPPGESVPPPPAAPEATR